MGQVERRLTLALGLPAADRPVRGERMKGPAPGYLYSLSGPSRVLALLESGPQTMAELRAVLPAWVRVSSILWSEEKRGRVVVLADFRPLRYVLA